MTHNSGPSPHFSPGTEQTPMVKADGISYFDEKDDIKTPEKLIKAIETFLRE